MATPEKIKINSTVIPQPDEGLGYDFETTYASDTRRISTGKLRATPMFTVEALTYTRHGMKASELSTILQAIVGQNFSLHYFSPYYGTWRDDTFYIGKGSIQIGILDDTTGLYDSVSFQMTGVNPLT